LATTEHFTRLFHREKLPLRVCCDANYLPFKSNSFPFIFCYQFLHHFPSPKPVMDEIYRVLSSGHFYFDEEPFKRVLKLNLYKQRNKIYSEGSLTKNKYMNLVESFISEAHCDEIEYGIIENNNISLSEWITALSIFDGYDVNLFSIYNITSKLEHRIRLHNVLNILLGGRIAGLCSKRPGVEGNSPIDIIDLLACPDCKIPSSNGSFDRPSLAEIPAGYKCTQCRFTYPCRDGILFLLPKAELQQLYPDA
jgi:SAM-dependent methyltransferase